MDHNAANTAMNRAAKAFRHATRQLAESESESARKRHARRVIHGIATKLRRGAVSAQAFHTDAPANQPFVRNHSPQPRGFSNHTRRNGPLLLN